MEEDYGKITNREETKALLNKMGIEFDEILHEPVTNVKEMIEKVKWEKGPLIFCKNLFFKNKKTKELLLIIALHDSNTTTKLLSKKLKFGSSDLRMGEEDLLNEYLSVTKGAVNPFSLVNDKEHKVSIHCQNALFDKEKLTFHPMENNASFQIASADLQKYLTNIGGKINLLDLDNVEEEEIKVEKKETQPKKSGKEKGKKTGDEEAKKIGIEYKKAENLAKWYYQVITKSEMIDYSGEISGIYVLRPWSYAIWEKIQSTFNEIITSVHSVENAYFPMFVSKQALEKEKKHIEGFKAEVAWVTHSGESPLAEPIAIRPTSETIMYPYFKKWIHSHRDLPLKLNQWTNIVRWEFRDPTPFIRTREFLWQEGHTAHATDQQANKFALDILQEYTYIYEDLLGIPVIQGKKSELEKFPGAKHTFSIETLIPSNGRGIQAATSHHLGCNFSEMFEIQFENEKREKEYVHQTSWGMTTRTIGTLVLLHSDDTGLILPPKVAPLQVVLIPIIYKNDKPQIIMDKLGEFMEVLRNKGNLRVKIDERREKTPSWKYNHWELKGVPVRVELGMKDYQKGVVTIVRRDNFLRIQVKWGDLLQYIQQLMLDLQNALFQKAKTEIYSRIIDCADWDNFMKILNQRECPLTPWCGSMDCEEKVKELSHLQSVKAEESMTGAAKTMNIPFMFQNKLKPGDKCFHCGEDATDIALWGRTY